MSQIKILVTGAGGFVGRALSAECIARGLVVQGATRTSNDLPNGVSNIVVGSINGSTNWHDALLDCSIVLHLAARVHVMHDNQVDPLKAFRVVNLDGTMGLARQAAAAGIKRFVFVSTVKVNGESTLPKKAFKENTPPNPQDDYGQSKHEAEHGLLQLSAKTGMEVVIIRPPLVYGPSVRANFAALMRAVQRGWPLPLGAVHNQRSFVGLDNLVDFIITCATHPKAANQTFLVSDGQDISTTELIRMMAKTAGVTARLWSVPSWLLQVGAQLLGKGSAMQRLCGNLQVDISKAQELLGWVPAVSVEDGLIRAFPGDRSPPFGSIRQYMKRSFDILLSVFAILILAIPCLVIALLVRLTSSGPALYWSDRIGKNNTIFRMPKFRSMRIETPAVATHLLKNSNSYLTPIGSFLRKSSLDELPQLWTILKGDMSFVGPRPALFNQDDLIALRTQYGVEQLVPGLTGWAQINGRDELPIPAKVALDKEYLDQRSLTFDITILWLTFVRVLKRDGVSH
jgi:lipopolysaccharide/colanic/teichoic acid biosynthesis glycosyltransferase/nucleoside-diphosphate-sugar epimerase